MPSARSPDLGFYAKSRRMRARIPTKVNPLKIFAKRHRGLAQPHWRWIDLSWIDENIGAQLGQRPNDKERTTRSRAHTDAWRLDRLGQVIVDNKVQSEILPSPCQQCMRSDAEMQTHHKPLQISRT